MSDIKDMLSGGNQTDGTFSRKILTSYQNSRLPLITKIMARLSVPRLNYCYYKSPCKTLAATLEYEWECNRNAIDPNLAAVGVEPWIRFLAGNNLKNPKERHTWSESRPPCLSCQRSWRSHPASCRCASGATWTPEKKIYTRYTTDLNHLCLLQITHNSRYDNFKPLLCWKTTLQDVWQVFFFTGVIFVYLIQGKEMNKSRVINISNK